MSQKKYGHARSEHGAQRSAQSLKDRAVTKNTPQGHFQDNKMIEEAFEKAPSKPGVHHVEVSNKGKVYYPDGSEVETKKVRVVIKGTNEAPKPKKAFPVDKISCLE